MKIAIFYVVKDIVQISDCFVYFDLPIGLDELCGEWMSEAVNFA